MDLFKIKKALSNKNVPLVSQNMQKNSFSFIHETQKLGLKSAENQYIGVKNLKKAAKIPYKNFNSVIIYKSNNLHKFTA
ncbi:MAG: hypothetical protein ACOX1H_00400 [Pseudoramibacter sp.]